MPSCRPVAGTFKARCGESARSASRECRCLDAGERIFKEVLICPLAVGIFKKEVLICPLAVGIFKEVPSGRPAAGVFEEGSLSRRPGSAFSRKC